MTAILINNKKSQSIRIPKSFRLDCEEVVVEKLGDGLFIRPAKPSNWPEGYFDRIRISDNAFGRPEQGPLPDVTCWKK